MLTLQGCKIFCKVTFGKDGFCSGKFCVCRPFPAPPTPRPRPSPSPVDTRRSNPSRGSGQIRYTSDSNAGSHRPHSRYRTQQTDSRQGPSQSIFNDNSRRFDSGYSGVQPQLNIQNNQVPRHNLGSSQTISQTGLNQRHFNSRNGQIRPHFNQGSSQPNFHDLRYGSVPRQSLYGPGPSQSNIHTDSHRRQYDSQRHFSPQYNPNGLNQRQFNSMSGQPRFNQGSSQLNFHDLRYNSIPRQPNQGYPRFQSNFHTRLNPRGFYSQNVAGPSQSYAGFRPNQISSHNPSQIRSNFHDLRYSSIPSQSNSRYRPGLTQTNVQTNPPRHRFY